MSCKWYGDGKCLKQPLGPVIYGTEIKRVVRGHSDCPFDNRLWRGHTAQADSLEHAVKSLKDCVMYEE